MSSVLDPARRTMPMPMPVRPLARSALCPMSAPSETEATSPTRVVPSMRSASKGRAVRTFAVARTDRSCEGPRQRARRGVEGDRGERLGEVGDVQTAGGEVRRVDVDAEDLLPIAVDLHVGDPIDGREAIDHPVLDDDRQLLGGQRVGGDREPQDRPRRRRRP